MTDIPDYPDYKDDEIGANLEAVLIALADQQEAAEAEVIRLQALLDEATMNVRRISETEIPNVLDGLEGSFTLPDGRVVKVAEKVYANISKGNEVAAHKWMNDNGHGSLVKQEITIKFGKGEEDKAKEFKKYLSEHKSPLDIKYKKSVHPQTLMAFARQQLKEGIDLPKDLFGVFRQRFSKVK